MTQPIWRLTDYLRSLNVTRDFHSGIAKEKYWKCQYGGDKMEFEWNGIVAIWQQVEWVIRHCQYGGGKMEHGTMCQYSDLSEMWRLSDQVSRYHVRMVTWWRCSNTWPSERQGDNWMDGVIRDLANMAAILWRPRMFRGLSRDNYMIIRESRLSRRDEVDGLTRELVLLPALPNKNNGFKGTRWRDIKGPDFFFF